MNKTWKGYAPRAVLFHMVVFLSLNACKYTRKNFGNSTSQSFKQHCVLDHSKLFVAWSCKWFYKKVAAFVDSPMTCYPQSNQHRKRGRLPSLPTEPVIEPPWTSFAGTAMNSCLPNFFSHFPAFYWRQCLRRWHCLLASRGRYSPPYDLGKAWKLLHRILQSKTYKVTASSPGLHCILSSTSAKPITIPEIGTDIFVSLPVWCQYRPALRTQQYCELQSLQPQL